MKKLQIIYFYVADEFNSYSCIIKNMIIECLSVNHEIECYENKYPEQQEQIKLSSCDLVLIQNSQSLIDYQSVLKSLKNTPLIFVSYGYDIRGYLGPIDNLVGVFKFGEADMESWGIPDEIQTSLKIPVRKTNKNAYRKKNSQISRLVYYPTRDSIATSDYVLLSVLKKLNKVNLTIVCNSYSVLASSFPAGIQIIPKKTFLHVLPQADIVIASGYEAIQAMADGKRCIILGAYGLGGLVQPDNYEMLQKWNFQGRAGGSFQEYVPPELLAHEINKALQGTNEENLRWLQKQVTGDYSEQLFQNKINERLKSILSVSGKLKNKKTMLQLKPVLTSVFSLEEIDGLTYIKRGNNHYDSIDEELQTVLQQCNGQNTLQNIVDTNGYDKENITILCANLRELARKKLVVFYE